MRPEGFGVPHFTLLATSPHLVDLQESQNSSVNHQIQAAWQIHRKPDRWETFPLSYVQSWDYVRLTDIFDMDCTNQILCIGHTSALQRNKRSLIVFNHDELLDVSYTVY